MPRQQKDVKVLNCKINKTVSDSLDEFIEHTGMTKTSTVEKALTEYIDRYKKTGRISTVFGDTEGKE